MKKRALSLALALAMSLTPTTAFAQQQEHFTQDSGAQEEHCICIDVCSEETVNFSCDVCGIETDFASVCDGTPQDSGEASLFCSCEIFCSDEQANSDCTVCAQVDAIRKEVCLGRPLNNKMRSVSNVISVATLQDLERVFADSGTVPVTVELSQNITLERLTPMLTVSAGRTMILDLKGKTINAENSEAPSAIENNGNLTITDTIGGGKILGSLVSLGSEPEAILNNATLIINGKAEIVTKKFTGYGGNPSVVAVRNYGDLILSNNATLSVLVTKEVGVWYQALDQSGENAKTTILDNATLSSTARAIAVLISEGTLEMSGGKIQAPNICLRIRENAVVNISGGLLQNSKAKQSVIAASGTLNMTGGELDCTDSQGYTIESHDGAKISVSDRVDLFLNGSNNIATFPFVSGTNSTYPIATTVAFDVTMKDNAPLASHAVVYGSPDSTTPLTNVTASVDVAKSKLLLTGTKESPLRPGTYYIAAFDRARGRGYSTTRLAVTTGVPVTGLQLNKSATTLTVGSAETLTVTLSPVNATNKNIRWSSSDTKIATVNPTTGRIQGISDGIVTINALTVDGNKIATCTVTVKKRTSGGGGGGGGGGSKKTTISAANAKPAVPVSKTVDLVAAQTGTTQAIAAALAKSAVTQGPLLADVRFTNTDYITLETLDTINNAAQKAAAGKTVALSAGFDCMVNGVAVSSLALSPTELANLLHKAGSAKTTQIQLGFSANPQDASVSGVQRIFSESFQNKLAVISFSEKAPLSVNARIKFKLDLSKFDTTKLAFYYYHPGTNVYQPIVAANHQVDANGFIHLTVPLGGSVIISEGPLVLRS